MANVNVVDRVWLVKPVGLDIVDNKPQVPW